MGKKKKELGFDSAGNDCLQLHGNGSVGRQLHNQYGDRNSDGKAQPHPRARNRKSGKRCDAALAGRSNSEDVRKEIFHELH